jgi:serine/threonine-protein kinase
MNKPFHAYSGDQPYIFVSYAHEDANAVFPEMKWLHDQGFNVWYDEGISPGTVWRTELADSIMAAGLFLFFVTPRSVVSSNCEKEVNFAIDHDIPVLTVHLEETDLPSGIELTLSSIQGILKHDLPDQDYREKLLAATGEHLHRGLGVSTSVSPIQFGKVAVVAVAVLGLLLAGYLAINLLPADPPLAEPQEESSLRRFTIDLPRSMRTENYGYRPVTISADGQRVVFNAVVEQQAQLYSRSLDSLDVVPIKGTENASRGLALSPDGQWIAFADRSDSLLKKVPVSGGVPVTLCDPIGRVWDVSWGANGNIVYTSDAHAGLMTVSSSGGTPEQLTVPENGEFHKQPNFLPDGNALFFTIGEPGTTTRKTDRIAVFSLQSGEQKTLMAGASPRATPSGHLIYYLENALWAVAFDAERLEVISESVPVAEGVLYVDGAHYSISDDGTFVYVLATDLVPRTLVWVDRFGNEETLPLERKPYHQPRISPDGAHVAVVVESNNGADLWMYSLDRGTGTRLTFDESREASPLWSPDGNHIIYSSNRVDDVFRITTDGTGVIQQLTDSPHYQFAYSITPDGRQLLFAERGSNIKGSDLAILTISSEPTSDSLLQTEFSEGDPAISPDGHWLAYTSDRSGKVEVYIRPFPNVDAAVWQVSVNGGRQPRWNPNGRELIYWGPTDLMVVAIETAPDFEARLPESLFNLQNFIYYSLRNFDVDSTGEHFLMVKKPSEDEMPNNRIVIVQNWLDDVARKFATN